MNHSTWQDLPKEIQEEMLNEQERQGNKRDAGVFEKDICASTIEGGFNWFEHKVLTEDGWGEITLKGSFAPFYEKFPKKDPDTIAWDEPREMLAWDEDETLAKPREVHGKFKNCFVVYIASGDVYDIYKHAKEITPQINWDEFKKGDVVEVEWIDNDSNVCYFCSVSEYNISMKIYKNKDAIWTRTILEIKSIRKLK